MQCLLKLPSHISQTYQNNQKQNHVTDTKAVLRKKNTAENTSPLIISQSHTDEAVLLQ